MPAELYYCLGELELGTEIVNKRQQLERETLLYTFRKLYLHGQERTMSEQRIR